MGSGVCGRCCCPRRQTGNQPSLAQKRGQRDQQLYYLKPVLSGMEVLKLYNRIFSFPLIFPFPFQVYRPVTRALVMPSSFAGLSWSWLDLVVWANDQEFWTWQNLGRNPASISSLFIAWAIYWIYVLEQSIMRVNVKFLWQNFYLFQNHHFHSLSILGWSRLRWILTSWFVFHCQFFLGENTCFLFKMIWAAQCLSQEIIKWQGYLDRSYLHLSSVQSIKSRNWACLFT